MNRLLYETVRKLEQPEDSFYWRDGSRMEQWFDFVSTSEQLSFVYFELLFEFICVLSFQQKPFMTYTDPLTNVSIQMEACREKVLHDIAVVTILVDSDQIMKIEQDVRVTLVDKIGMLGASSPSRGKILCLGILNVFLNSLPVSGGTIGLFTGLSIISLVEAAFWIFRTIKSLVVNRGRQ